MSLKRDRAQDEDDATKRGAVRDARATTLRLGRLLRQQRFDS
jgi:hypothetical protein